METTEQKRTTCHFFVLPKVVPRGIWEPGFGANITLLGLGLDARKTSSVVV